jgi:hypothetical protein
MQWIFSKKIVNVLNTCFTALHSCKTNTIFFLRGDYCINFIYKNTIMALQKTGKEFASPLYINWQVQEIAAPRTVLKTLASWLKEKWENLKITY